MNDASHPNGGLHTPRNPTGNSPVAGGVPGIHLRNTILLLLAGTLILQTIGIVLLLRWDFHRRMQAQHVSVSGIAQAIDRHIFSHFQSAAEAIGHHPQTASLVSGTSSPDNPDILLILNCARDLLQADIAYILDSEGTVLACSPYEGQETLTGNNYRFRPYFATALAGQANVYPALGVTTGKRGLYIAVPVPQPADSEKHFGVVTIKVGLDLIDALLSREAQGRTMALLSPEGIVFASTNPTWLYHAAWPIDDSIRARLLSGKQFGQQPLNPLSVLLNQQQVALPNGRHDVIRQAITLDGWHLVALVSHRLPWPEMVMFLIASTGALLFGVTRLLQRSRRERMQLEIRRQNTELKSINTKLQDEISERLRAESESLKHRTMHETVFKNSCDAMMLLEDTQLIECNDTALGLFGFRREELLGQTLWELSPHLQDDGRSSQEQSQKMLAHTAAIGRNQFEWNFRRWDATTFPAEVVLTQIPFESRTLVHMVVRDITAQKEEEAQLRLFKRAVAQSTDGIVITDLEGQVLFGNQSWADMHGYAIEDLAGMPVVAFLDSSCSTEEDFDMSLWRQGAAGVEQWHRRRDTTCFPALISCTAITGSRQEAVAYLVIARNISDRIEAEQALHRAKEAAEAANRAKSDFLANMSHEIRTPMNGIIGLTRLLGQTALTPEQHAKLQLVASSADRLMDLINNILDFSKIEAGRVELEEIEFSPAEEIARLLSVMQVKAKEKGLYLNQEIDPLIPHRLFGDSTRLLQILTNLITNGIKFTAQGGITLLLEADHYEEHRLWLRCSVRDTGIGIPQDKQGLIFDAFTQADTSHTRKFGGTGLGLSICSQLCELMGGSIVVTSTEGAGSTFVCLLPFRLPDGVPAQAETPQAIQLESPHNREDILQGVKVLLAEDEFINTTLAVALLQQAGMQVDTVDNGQAAVEAWHEGNYAVLLMDIQMPELDGYQATNSIRSMEKERGGHVPIIAMTAHAMQGDRAKCLKAGMDDYVTKPIDPELLYQALERQLVPTALVVDDQPVSQRIASKLLVSFGWRVSLAATGRQALTACDSSSFSLILMDIEMPEMDGLEASRHIRQLEESTGKHCHIVALSGRDDQAAACLEAGMDDFLAKPLTAETLRRVLEKWPHSHTGNPS